MQYLYLTTDTFTWEPQTTFRSIFGPVNIYSGKANIFFGGRIYTYCCKGETLILEVYSAVET